MYKSEIFTKFTMCRMEFSCSHLQFFLSLNYNVAILANQKTVQLSLQLVPKVVSLKVYSSQATKSLDKLLLPHHLLI